MKKTTPPAVQDAPPAEDPHAGQGGSYELDPATGQRRLVQRTEVQPPATPATTPETPTPPTLE